MVQSTPRPDLPLSARLRQDLKNDLIAGLLVVIPLATTIWLSTIVSRFVLAFLTSIPKQMESQLQRFEAQRTRESRQRLIGGTASAVVLAVAFALLALTAVL